MRSRITAMMVCFGLLATAVVGRAVHIQIIGDPRLERLAKRQFQSKVLIRPRRGAILDRNGEPLAVNLEIQSLAANPTKIKNKKTLARLLSKSTGVAFGTIYRRLKSKREFVWIKRHLSDHDQNRLRRFGVIDTEGDLAAGLWTVKESKRVYPHGELASHVLGSVNLDSEGLEGVELWANEQLHGKVVSVSAIRDALGRPTFIDAVAAKDVKDGNPVALTIDASLQFSVEQELKNAVEKASARSGSVIVMDALNGEILAMANEPSFNPNNKSASPPAHRRNRVLTDGFEPGSTMKSILLASALANGSKLTDRIHGEHGSIVIQGRRISEAESHEKFEMITLKRFLQVSSNVVAAKLALKLGAEKYLATLRALGFGDKTSTGFPGEISGRLPKRKGMTPLTLANIGFGQAVLVTPMQMLRAYAAFANGGYLVQPTLLKNPLPGIEQKPPRRVLPAHAVSGVTTALESVTGEGGTGMKAALEGYRVAGKTGTAQVVDPETGRYSRSRYISSFIGYPVGVERKLVIFTSIDGPRGIYYASETAAPLFRAVLHAAVNRYSIPANIPVNMQNGRKLAGEKPVISDRLQYSLAKVATPDEEMVDAGVEWHGTGPKGELLWKMPALEGLTPREALRILKGRDFELEMRGAGLIKSQSPEAGKIISDGSRIRISLAEP